MSLGQNNCNKYNTADITFCTIDNNNMIADALNEWNNRTKIFQKYPRECRHRFIYIIFILEKHPRGQSVNIINYSLKCSFPSLVFFCNPLSSWMLSVHLPAKELFFYKTITLNVKFQKFYRLFHVKKEEIWEREDCLPPQFAERCWNVKSLFQESEITTIGIRTTKRVFSIIISNAL